MANIFKTQFNLQFAKGKLTAVQAEVERLADNTEQTTKSKDVYLVAGVDPEQVLMAKKSVLRQVAQFLGNSNGELDAEFQDSVRAEFGTTDYSVVDRDEYDEDED